MPRGRDTGRAGGRLTRRHGPLVETRHQLRPVGGPPRAGPVHRTQGAGRIGVGGAQQPRRVIVLRGGMGARRVAPTDLFDPRISCVRAVPAPVVLAATEVTLSSAPSLSKVGSTIVEVTCRASGVVDRVRAEEKRRGFGRVVTVASLSCSPVRRNRCWNIEPPVVATTLTTPAPMMVP